MTSNDGTSDFGKQIQKRNTLSNTTTLQNRIQDVGNMNSINASKAQQKRGNNYNKLIEVLLCPTDRLVLANDERKIQQNQQNLSEIENMRRQKPRNGSDDYSGSHNNELYTLSPQNNQKLPQLKYNLVNIKEDQQDYNRQETNLSQNQKQLIKSTVKKQINQAKKESFINMLKTLEQQNNVQGTSSNANTTLSKKQAETCDRKVQAYVDGAVVNVNSWADVQITNTDQINVRLSLSRDRTPQSRIRHINAATTQQSIETKYTRTKLNEHKNDLQRGYISHSQNSRKLANIDQNQKSKKYLPLIGNHTSVTNGHESNRLPMKQAQGKNFISNEMLQGKKIQILNTLQVNNLSNHRQEKFQRANNYSSGNQNPQLSRDSLKRINSGANLKDNNTLPNLTNENLRQSLDNFNGSSNMTQQNQSKQNSVQKPPHPNQNSLYQRVQRQGQKLSQQEIGTTFQTQSNSASGQMSLDRQIKKLENQQNYYVSIDNQGSSGVINKQGQISQSLQNSNKKQISSDDSIYLQATLSPQNIGKFKRNRLLYAVKDSSDQNQDNLNQLLDMLDKNKKVKINEVQKDSQNIDSIANLTTSDEYYQSGVNKFKAKSKYIKQDYRFTQSLKPNKDLQDKAQFNKTQNLQEGINVNRFKLDKFQASREFTQSPKEGQLGRSKQNEVTNFMIEGQQKAIMLQSDEQSTILNVEQKNLKVIKVKKKNSDQQQNIGFQSYSVSPKALTQIQSKSNIQTIDLDNFTIGKQNFYAQRNQLSQPSNNLKYLLKKYPSLLKEAPLSEEASIILQMDERLIETLTFEIDQNTFDKTFKASLCQIFGQDILSNFRSESTQLDLTLTTSNEPDQNDNESPKDKLKTITKNQMKQAYPSSQNYNSKNFGEYNKDLNDLIKVNQLESVQQRKIKTLKQQQIDKDEINLKKLYPDLRLNQINVQVIKKYSDLYSTLKIKYNHYRKQFQNQEIDQCQFIASRDLSLLTFLIKVQSLQTIEIAQNLLKPIKNLILVVKESQESKQAINQKYTMIERKSYGLRQENTDSQIMIQSPKLKQNQSRSILDSTPEKLKAIEQIKKQIVGQKRALSSTSILNLESNDKTRQNQLSFNNTSIKKNTINQNDMQLFQQLLSQVNDEVAQMLETIDPQYQTKIKIIHQPYTHLRKSRLNKAFRIYNEFIALTFKNKEKAYNQARILQLGKYFGVQINKSNQGLFNENYFKNKETALPLKEKLNFFLIQIINQENDITVPGLSSNGSSEQFYRYNIGTGNNSLLVKSLMKQRWWWYQKDTDKNDIEELNFIWTQWRKIKIVNQLKTLKQLNEETKEQNSNEDSMNINSINSSFNNSSPKNNLKSNGLLSQSTMSQTIYSQKESTSKQTKKAFNYKQSTEMKLVDAKMAAQIKLYNKLEDNFHLSNKKALFLNMRNYYEAVSEDISLALPLTFHIKTIEDPEYQRFKDYFLQIQDEALVSQQKIQNIWIIKPGENTNRGQGIEVRKDLQEITNLIQQYSSKKRTVIVQRYIHNPLLINKRKFDIRCFALVTSVKGNIKAYFFRDGYLRTSSKEFSLNNLQNRMVHLTNDAVQKHAEDYGKYEPGNKMSYEDFQRFLNSNHSNLKIDFNRDLLPQIQKLVTDTIRGTFSKLDPNKRVNSFEIFGYDFMFDDQFKIYLIEANTNPCLELSSPLLAKLIPQMVDNVFRIAVDPLFPPPENFAWKKSMLGDICQENKFELIFDEKIDGPALTEILKEKENIIIEIDEDEEDLEDDECDE